MTLFFLEFDRREHRLVGPQETFDENSCADAFARRAALQERALADNLDRDIVLLEAESEAHLRRTHGSFFFSPDELTVRFQYVV